MGRYSHSLSLNATIMVSKNCPTIGEHVGIIFTLNFRKFKVALNRINRIFLNFAKSCILSCLSKFYNKKKIHGAVSEI